MQTGGPDFHAFFWLILVSFVVAVLVRRIQVPYALALVITGLVVGIPHLIPHARLDPKTLLFVFLPPLLFESAFHLRADLLKRDWKPIAIYTLFGTIASTLISGWIVSRVLHIGLAVALVFGALIATTDPISIIAVFRRLGAGRRLSLIIEAESLFNNDTAVVLFTVTLAAASGASVTLSAGIIQFFRLMLGGAAAGAAIGYVASRLHSHLDDRLIEITLTSIAAYGSYMSAESLQVSGVMATVVAGVMVGSYGTQIGMSPSTRLAVIAFWEYAAFVVNSIVFLLVGIEVSYVSWADKIIPTIVAVAAVLAGRAAIYPLSLLVNYLKGDIPLAWQHILFWGGLRGALSMALVLDLDRQFPYRDLLVAMTFGVVLFSLLGQGLSVGPLLKKLGLAALPHPISSEERHLAGEILAAQAALEELQKVVAEDTFPNWAVESLARKYRSRLEILAERMERLHPGHSKLQDREAAEARWRALVAAKNALREAEKSGWLDDENWQALLQRLDSELVEILQQRAGPS